MSSPNLERLLSRAARRQRLVCWGRKFRQACLILSALALVLLLCSRLLGVLPDWFRGINLGVVPLLALGVSLLLTPRITPWKLAHELDVRSGGKELFLSAAMIEKSPGEFAPIVMEQAEKKAGEVDASRLFPYRWWAGLRDVLLALAVLASAALWVPRFDPFKMEEKRQVATKQNEHLAQVKQLTAARKAELDEKGSALDEKVDQAMAKLDKTFKEMKPLERDLNAKKLNEEVQEVGDLWKRAGKELPVKAPEQAAQKFGSMAQQKQVKDLIEKLKKGDASGLKEQIEKMREEMKKAAQQPNSAAKKEQMENLAKQLAEMAAQMRDQLGAKELNEALTRAVEQLDMAKMGNMTKDALDGANESMQLSQDELQHMADMFKDMQDLEDALKNLQMAKQINEAGQLNGKLTQEALEAGMSYEEYYQKLLAQAEGEQTKIGKGGGSNPFRGDGGTVGEDDTAKSDFKKEKASSQLTAGKLLMQWKEPGVGDVGNKVDDYVDAVRAVKQEVSEAIRNEQVPPGYHDAIQKYFDALPEKKP